MPYCPNCGIPVDPSQKFCPNCGQRLGPVPTPPPQGNVVQAAPVQPVIQSSPVYASPPPPVPSAQVGEMIVSIVSNLKKPKSFGRWDLYNLIVTDKRCIFALLTGDMLNRAIKEANERGSREGKGFMDRWGDQMQASVGYWRRYESMEPELALRENRENFSFDVHSVRKTKCDRKDRQQGKVKQHFWEVEIEAQGGKYKFESDYDPRDAMLRAFGNK